MDRDGRGRLEPSVDATGLSGAARDRGFRRRTRGGADRRHHRALGLAGRALVAAQVRHEMDMLQHAADDHVMVLAGPRDRALEALADADLRGEPEPLTRFGRIAEALTGAVPVARRLELRRGRVAGQAVDKFGQVANRRLDAGAEIVDLARLAAQGASDQAARDVLDEDEVARRDAAVLDRQRLAMQGFPNEGRGHVAPYG